MKHEFDSVTKAKFFNVFSWDKDRIDLLFQAMLKDDLSQMRLIMQESEEELVNQLKQRLTCDETDVHNARIETLDKMKECYTIVEDQIKWYLDNIDKRLKYDVHCE